MQNFSDMTGTVRLADNTKIHLYGDAQPAWNGTHGRLASATEVQAAESKLERQLENEQGGTRQIDLQTAREAIERRAAELDAQAERYAMKPGGDRSAAFYGNRADGLRIALDLLTEVAENF